MLIRLKNISKSYAKNLVLSDVSFSVPEGTVTGIIGPNGAGKSTLIKILTQFEFADSGSVFLDQMEVKNFPQIKKHIAYMPEKMELYPEYFTDEFLDFFHKGMRCRDEALFNALSLQSIRGKRIKQLSKGWHQRLKLYTALCNHKNLVILDEPFEGFDPLQMQEIATIIRDHNQKGREFILSIHQLSYAQKICNYFLFLNKGKLIAEGSLEFLSEKYSVPNGDLEEILLRVIDQ